MIRKKIYLSGTVIEKAFLVLGVPDYVHDSMKQKVVYLMMSDKEFTFSEAAFRKKCLESFMAFYCVPLFGANYDERALFLNQSEVLDYDSLVHIYLQTKKSVQLSEEELKFILTKTVLSDDTEERPKFYDSEKELKRWYSCYLLFKKKEKALRKKLQEITPEKLPLELEKVKEPFPKNRILAGVLDDKISLFAYGSMMMNLMDNGLPDGMCVRRPYDLYDTGIDIWY